MQTIFATRLLSRECQRVNGTKQGSFTPSDKAQVVNHFFQLYSASKCCRYGCRKRCCLLQKSQRGEARNRHTIKIFGKMRTSGQYKVVDLSAYHSREVSTLSYTSLCPDGTIYTSSHTYVMTNTARANGEALGVGNAITTIAYSLTRFRPCCCHGQFVIPRYSALVKLHTTNAKHAKHTNIHYVLRQHPKISFRRHLSTAKYVEAARAQQRERER